MKFRQLLGHFQRRSFAFGVAAPLLAAFCVFHISNQFASASNDEITDSISDFAFDNLDPADTDSPVFSDADGVAIALQADGVPVDLLTSSTDDLKVDSDEVATELIPEPSTLLLAGFAIFCAGIMRKR